MQWPSQAWDISSVLVSIGAVADTQSTDRDGGGSVKNPGTGFPITAL